MNTEHDGVRPGISRRTLLARTGAAAAALAVGPVIGGIQPAMAASWRVPGEDAPHKRTWMAWPSSSTIWGSLLSKIQADIAKLAKEVAKYEPVIMCADGSSAASQARAACGSTVTVISSIPVSDCWMRDTGPLFRVDGAGGLDSFGLNFNAWGENATTFYGLPYSAYSKDRVLAGRVAAYSGVGFSKSSVVGEGGGIEYDGDGTLMATESCWLNSNRNPGKSRSQVEAELLARFGATKMIWLPGVTGYDVTDGHIDGTARYIKPGVVMVQLAGDVRPDVWTANAQAMHNVLSNATDARGRRLQVLTIEGPDTLPRIPSGKRADFLSSYMNWTVTNSAIITTQFGDTAKDAAAKAAISAAYGRPVVQLNLDNLYGNGGGGAHCVTMQEPNR
ncbi:Agmatine deiminase [Streptomyces venezuelae]|uniref:agmatine deiminase family protein n=1 Tax=Streptomyces gardneri TaxID=66892 RepID=UPI0006BCEEDF|nr:agmatine deiminase family protein [Streptomyces gardneri]ALO13060.1 Agmatine deiminase [Streptomyces venezuelae]QPK49736.1 agmatine deiminase family protein [Streptomyces gardneri]WRK41294.1 agmatine deiminase family protein [Streptomyces venezuelae]CUM36270.1 Agmatine deiminase [Streptomyces venezuelae]